MVLLALLGIFLGLTLFNSGAAVPEHGSWSPYTPPTGVTARPNLSVTRISPLTVSGRGFKNGERVTVSLNGTGRRQVVATRTGTFSVRMGGGRCNGGTIVAVGSKGSRAAANFSQLLCVAP
jgi:hypothetical protein